MDATLSQILNLLFLRDQENAALKREVAERDAQIERLVADKKERST